MNVDALISTIKENRLSNVEVRELQRISTLDLSSYELIIRTLLSDSEEQHRMDGCILFTLRPDPKLYTEVLMGAISIADPSNNLEGAVALAQVKSTAQIALDLLDILEGHPEDQILASRIVNLFYWIGSTVEQMVDTQWQIYLLTHLSQTLNIVRRTQSQLLSEQKFFPDLVVEDTESDEYLEMGLPSLKISRQIPPSDINIAQEAANRFLKYIIDQYEQCDIGYDAQLIVSYLANLNLNMLGRPETMPKELRDRVIQAYVRANQSTDPYIRSLVSISSIQSLISSNDSIG